MALWCWWKHPCSLKADCRRVWVVNVAWTEWPMISVRCAGHLVRYNRTVLWSVVQLVCNKCYQCSLVSVDNIIIKVTSHLHLVIESHPCCVMGYLSTEVWDLERWQRSNNSKEAKRFLESSRRLTEISEQLREEHWSENSKAAYAWLYPHRYIKAFLLGGCFLSFISYFSLLNYCSQNTNKPQPRFRGIFTTKFPWESDSITLLLQSLSLISSFCSVSFHLIYCLLFQPICKLLF